MNKIIAIFLLFSLPVSAQLIQTNWSVQSPTNCVYPLYTNGQQCLPNSHAIAMAQIINYYGHPEYPFMYRCYQSNVGGLCSEGLTILFDDTLLASSTILEIDIACGSSYSPYPLAWNCGLVSTDTLAKVFQDFYGYIAQTDSVSKAIPELRQNIADEKPFIVETYPYNYGCSRFVLIDGYDSLTDKWHCNWGWGWMHNNWCKIDSLWFSGQWYGKHNKAVYNITPDSITVTAFLIYEGTQDTINGYVVYDSDTVSAGQSYTVTKRELYPQPESTNSWGKVNSADALLILKHFTGMSLLTGLRKEAADINGDLYINSNDALLAAKRFVGQLLTFPTKDYIFEQKVLTTDGNCTIFGRCKGDVSP